ncbi:MAG: Uma2 family endonuclease [Hyphomicrobium sp.]|jgi:Uma2 family endonuclease
MLKPRARPATYADLDALPANVVGEIIFGALYAHPRPAPRHGSAANLLGYEVTGPFQRGRGGPGGWIFIVEPELHLGPHVVVPDLAGWRRERLTPFPETAFIETPPDWLCDVLSPSTQGLDRTDKLAIYAEHGVAHCWYVDPLARTLEVFALTGGKRLLTAAFKGADPVAAPPFEVHTFPLNALWVDDTPEPEQA